MLWGELLIGIQATIHAVMSVIEWLLGYLWGRIFVGLCLLAFIIGVPAYAHHEATKQKVVAKTIRQPKWHLPFIHKKG